MKRLNPMVSLSTWLANKSANSQHTVVLNWHPNSVSVVIFQDGKYMSHSMDIPKDMPPSTIGKAIKTLLAKYKLSKSVVVVCHHPQTMIRLMTTTGRPTQIASQITKKISTYAMFAGIESACTHVILSEEKTEDGASQHVLAAAIPKEMVTTITTTCQSAGIGISSIVPPSWEMMIALTKTINSGLVLLVGPKSSLLFQVYRGQLHHLQTLALGTESEWLTIESEVPRHITLLYQRITEAPETLYIYSDHYEWKPKLLALPIPLPASWVDTSPGIEESGNGYSYYARLSTGKNGNFLDNIPRQHHKKIWIRFLSYIIASCLLLLLLFFVLFILNRSIQNKINSVQKDLSEMHVHYQEVTRITRNLNEIKTHITGRRDLLKSRQNFDWHLYFRELPTLLTGHIKIESINGHVDGYLYMEGKAFSAEDVFAFLRQLKNISYLEKIELQEVIQEKESGMVRFSIKSKRKSL